MIARKILIASIIPLFLLSGCWGSLELEKNAYAVVIGLDHAEDNMIDVTFQIANPQVGTSSKAEAPNEPPSDIITITAPDILSAKELANSVVPRKLSFDHLQTIIIGEKLAKSNLFHNIIASSFIDPEMRRDNNLIVSKEKAREFIHKNKPKLETRPHKYYTYMQERWRDTGFVPISTLNRYFQRLSGELFLGIYASSEKNEETRKDEDGYVAGQVPQKSGDPVQMIGSAVFRNGKMIGTLTGEETRISLFLRKKGFSHSTIQSFPDPLDDKFRISVRVMKKGKTRVKVNTKKDPPEVNVTVPITIQVFSDPSLKNYTTDLKNQNLLKQSIKKDLETKTTELIKRTQTELKGEPFLWYLEARQHIWTVQEYKKYNWEKKYQTAKVEVKYDLRIENLGKQLKPENIKKH